MNVFAAINSTYRIVREYNIINNSVKCISLYIAYTRPNLRNLGVQTFVLMNVPTVLDYLSNLKLADKYKKYLEKIPLKEIKTMTNLITYSKLVHNFSELHEIIVQIPRPLSFIISTSEMFISLQLSYMKLSLIFSCVIIGTTTIIGAYLKKRLDNIIAAYIPNYQQLTNFVMNTFNHIPADTLANAVMNISNGQSLDINVVTPDNVNIKVVSIPRKLSISEEKLEELFPKCCPADKNYNIDELKFDQTNCGICSEEFNDSAKLLRILKCGHAYHCGCVDGWFFGGHLECPTCRKKIM